MLDDISDKEQSGRSLSQPSNIHSANQRGAPQSPISPTELGVESRKFIVYLEPCRSSKLYRSILAFYEKSRELYGLNEAHMYHPHTSMTGFFDFPLLPKSDVCERISLILHDLISCAKFQSGPTLESISRRAETVIIRIAAPPEFRTLMASFKSQIGSLLRSDPLVSDQSYFDVPAFHVRVKPMDHISLAYLSKVTLADGETRQLDSAVLDALHELARTTISWNWQDAEANEPLDWYFVLYETELRSQDISVPHRFRELKRWKVVVGGV